MNRTISLIQRVQIASPCPTSWDDMAGNDTVRFCSLCKLNVYNLSAMTEQEGERLIREKEGRMCARIFRRHDGTILTRDCPVGLRAIRRRLIGFGVRVAAMLIFIVCTAAYAVNTANNNSDRVWLAFLKKTGREETAYSRTIETLKRWTNTTPSSTFVMGMMVMPKTSSDDLVNCKPDGNDGP